jgi:hypothetical protein
VGLAEVVGVGLRVRAGDEALLGLGVAVVSGLSAERKLPRRIADATVTIIATASAPMIRLSRRRRDGPLGALSFAGSLGLEPPVRLLAGPAGCGSSVVMLDHVEPSQ